jgi:hypothetical protein
MRVDMRERLPRRRLFPGPPASMPIGVVDDVATGATMARAPSICEADKILGGARIASARGRGWIYSDKSGDTRTAFDLQPRRSASLFIRRLCKFYCSSSLHGRLSAPLACSSPKIRRGSDVFGFLPIESRGRDENRGPARTVAILRSVLEIGISVAIGVGRDKSRNISVPGNKRQYQSENQRRVIF